MDLLKPFKYLTRRVVSAITQKVDEIQQTEEDKKLLEKWKKQYEIDKSEKAEWNTRFDEWEAMYHGNREFGNIRNDDGKTPRTIINLPRLFVESQIDPNVPDPLFKPVAQDDEEAVQSLEAQVGYCVRAAEPTLEELNLEDERLVRKFGKSFYKVHWNNQVKKAGYVGDVEISAPHPKDIIPNAGCKRLDEMEHYHHPTNKTEAYVLRRWPHLTKEMLEKNAAYDDQYDTMQDTQRITINASDKSDSGSGLKKYTIIETTFRGKDGDIGKLWWSGDLLILNMPKFFYRRDEQGNITPKEVIGYQQDAEGNPIRDEQGNTIPIEADYYVPKRFDLVDRVYIPRDKSFWAVSLMEDLKDPQESLKKVLYNEEEKLLRGTTKIITNDSTVQGDLQNPLSEIIYAPAGTVVNAVKMDDGGDRGIQWMDKMKEYMQLLTRQTNAALGQETPEVTSGKQAEYYISQAMQVVDIAVAYKIQTYKRLYRVIADFYMAFGDYDRPWRLSGEGGQDVFGSFNRLAMLKDMNGHFVYPDFDIEIGAEAGFMKSRMQILQIILALAKDGRFQPTPDNLMVLRILDKIGVPHLKDAITSMEEALVQQQMMMQQQIQQQQDMANRQQDLAKQQMAQEQQKTQFDQGQAQANTAINAMKAMGGGGGDKKNG
jgi:hypothetical protein